ncbi:HlyD family efflux transporter periplasmic adaptor subunit [Pseudomonas borbori]|uniref:Membrane fusion protein, adhesin transport system n=1 Tax=Pseudomonas borbori TaxID=289003 RepID=A0A1I5U174_9PSED|nr:HlyD family efflux transporter periplasmic adaptor subunit [Pseudomonas borbori]SFP89050.1 membrane fusion protein, adhesin transport system [Pseudomonas borbori]
MWSDRFSQDDDARIQARVSRLQNSHRGRQGWLLMAVFIAVATFGVWASLFRIDEVARATGEVIASSRVQIIQSVDGGVLEQLLVKEGDRVAPGQLLALMEQTRLGASVGEVETRLFALQARATRLRAEVIGERQLVFQADLLERSPETARVEEALFKQRQLGLEEELRTMRVAVSLAQKELRLVEQLYSNGDASGSELLRVQRGLNEAEARLVNRRNKFLEDARLELVKAEDDIAQNGQTLTLRKQQQQDSVFTAMVPGIVKNIRVTTVGGVLRPGEELMQIIPVDDELMIEAKVSTADIARVVPGLEATVRFDTFDYTIFGGVKGEVAYVSADSLKEETNRGMDIYYRVRVKPASHPVTSTTGRVLEVLPGMTAQVDIRTGERTVMDYLLKPLRKTLSESFGER